MLVSFFRYKYIKYLQVFLICVIVFALCSCGLLKDSRGQQMDYSLCSVATYTLIIAPLQIASTYLVLNILFNASSIVLFYSALGGAVLSAPFVANTQNINCKT